MRTSIVVCILAFTGSGVAIYSKIKLDEELEIFNISLSSIDNLADGLAVDTDPLQVTWEYTGLVEDIEICLQNPRTGKQTKRIKLLSNEGRYIFDVTRNDHSYKSILETRYFRESNKVRVLFYVSNKVISTKEIEVFVGADIYVLETNPSTIEVFPVIDNIKIKYFSFIPEIAVPSKSDNNFSTLLLKGKDFFPQHIFKITPEMKNKYNFKTLVFHIASKVDVRLIRSRIWLDEIGQM